MPFFLFPSRKTYIILLYPICPYSQITVERGRKHSNSFALNMTLYGNFLLKNNLSFVKKIMHFNKALSLITLVGKKRSEVAKENTKGMRR